MKKWLEVSPYSGAPVMDEDAPANSVAGGGVDMNTTGGKKKKKQPLIDRQMMDARTKGYREHRARLEAARAKREERKRQSKFIEKVKESVTSQEYTPLEEVDLDEKFTRKDFDDNEDKNHHTENAVELVNMFGDNYEKRQIAQIKKDHDKNRSISAKDQKVRDALVKKYLPKLKEEVELDEAKFELYHDSLSSAMRHAFHVAKKHHGITIDPTEIRDKVAMGPSKPSSGKTNKYSLKGDKGTIQIQVYNKGGGKKPFELNMYKS